MGGGRELGDMSFIRGRTSIQKIDIHTTQAKRKERPKNAYPTRVDVK
jgi:hypothetical protein